MKVVLTMVPNPNRPKHSTRFDQESVEGLPPDAVDRFKASFYIPKPVAQNAKRIRVTIEEVD